MKNGAGIPHSQYRDFSDGLQQGAANTFKPVELTRDDTALLQYTGGTTGVAKGAVLSQRQYLRQYVAGKKNGLKTACTKARNGYCRVAALSYLALTVNLMIFANTGSKIILITNPAI